MTIGRPQHAPVGAVSAATARQLPDQPSAAQQARSSDQNLHEGGEILGRFKLDSVLGKGGAGTVWRAYDQHLGREVAIKALPRTVGDKALNEAQAAARLQHPAIVSVFDIANSPQHLWLIAELVEGDHLRKVLEQKSLSDLQLMHVGMALYSGLAHAHRRGILHRDVTPRNIIVPADAFAADGTVRPDKTPAKLADFGIAGIENSRLLQAEFEAQQEALRVGRPAKIVGTLNYMPPERLQGSPGDTAGDVWQAATVLHHLFAGRHPLGTADTAQKLLDASDKPTLLQQARPDLPHRLTWALDQAMNPDPGSRPTAGEMSDIFCQQILEKNQLPAQTLIDPAEIARRSQKPNNVAISNVALTNSPLGVVEKDQVSPSLPSHVRRLASHLRVAEYEQQVTPEWLNQQPNGNKSANEERIVVAARRLQQVEATAAQRRLLREREVAKQLAENNKQQDIYAQRQSERIKRQQDAARQIEAERRQLAAAAAAKTSELEAKSRSSVLDATGVDHDSQAISTTALMIAATILVAASFVVTALVLTVIGMPTLLVVALSAFLAAGVLMVSLTSRSEQSQASKLLISNLLALARR